MKDEETKKVERALEEFGHSMWRAGLDFGRGNPVHRTRISDVLAGVGLSAYVRYVTSVPSGGRFERALVAFWGVVYLYLVIDACRNSWRARRP